MQEASATQNQNLSNDLAMLQRTTDQLFKRTSSMSTKACIDVLWALRSVSSKCLSGEIPHNPGMPRSASHPHRHQFLTIAGFKQLFRYNKKCTVLNTLFLDYPQVVLCSRYVLSLVLSIDLTWYLLSSSTSDAVPDSCISKPLPLLELLMIRFRGQIIETGRRRILQTQVIEIFTSQDSSWNPRFFDLSV